MDAVEVNDTPPNEEGIESPLDICRVCLLGNLLMRDLFLENGIASLSVKAMSFANVKMMPGDGLPARVCTDCADKLESAYEFKLQVEHADNVLREKYDTLSVKEEELFFNEVEVNLEVDRTDSIGDMGIEQHYQTSPQSFDSNNAKSLLKNQYELLQVETLVQNESLEQESSSPEILEQQDIVADSAGENMDEKPVEAEDNERILIDNNSGDKQSLKLIPCVDAIPAEEHDYIMQQQYVVQEPSSTEAPNKRIELKKTEEDYMMNVSSTEHDDENNCGEKDETFIKCEEEVGEEEQPRTENRKSKRKLLRRIERDSNDEENYFENLNLSSRLKKTQVDRPEKIFFVCYLCDKQFLSKNVLKEHMHSHEEMRRALSLKKIQEKQQKAPPKMPSSGKRATKCPHCGKEYLYLISFNKHLKRHEREKEKEEDDTSFELYYEEEEQQRDSDFEDEKPVEDTSEEKERHHEYVRRKLRRKPRCSIFECGKCSEKFSSKISLKRHEQLAHTMKCNVCEEEFDRFEDLKHHRAKHVVEGVLTENDIEADGMERENDGIDNGKDLDRPLENNEEQDSENRCDIDEETIGNVRDSTFEGGVDEEEYYYDDYDGGSGDVSGAGGEDIESTTVSLMESEKDKDNLKCTYCSVECTSKRSLARHMLTHSESKHTCKICGQEFLEKDHLRRHVEQHGARIKSFKCMQCNKTFGHELTLRNHLIATNHKTFIQGQEYDPNKRIKRVAARAAQKIIDKIKTEDDLDDYEDERNEEEHDSADIHYGRKSSTKSRQGRKDLECVTCNKKCTSKQSLTKHMEQHAKEERIDNQEKGKDAVDRKEQQQRTINDMNELHESKYGLIKDDRQTSDDNSDFESGLDWPMDSYECATCKKRYSTKKSLLRHQLLHEEPNFECDICNVKFYRKDKLKAHYDKCSEKNPDQVRKCNICGDSFENNEMLRQHRSKHVTEGILTEEDLRDIEPRVEERKQGEKVVRKRRTDIVGLECTECNKRYTSRKGLLRHIQVHEGKKYLCDICPKKFYRREHLKIHVAKHNMVKPYKCTRCTKRFIKEDQLTSHLSKHDRSFKKSKETDSSKRFLCEICSKSFTQSTTLIAHLRAHNGIKPYVCEVCSRPFTTNAYLKMHMRTHTQEKPYICQYCSRAFARADTLANHLTSHTGEAKYHCKYCPKNFRRLKSLKEHVFIHTGQRPYACPTCDRRFNNNGSRYAHSKRCKQNLLQSQARNNQQEQQIQLEQAQQQFQQSQRIQQQGEVIQASQLVKAQNIKTIAITRQTDAVSATQQIMQHQEILMPLILPFTVTLADVGEEVVLPEDTKIFTTS